MINNWKQVFLNNKANLKDAMKILNDFASRIVIIVEESNNNLVGTITDGDIRRGLLRGLTLEASVVEVMNTSPVTASFSMNSDTIHNILRQEGILAIPIVDNNKKVVGLETIDSLDINSNSDVSVVLMAGGFGKRLYPLTNNLPKPMLTVGIKPILENIIENFVSQGFRNFYISTFYKSEIIKNHFKDGRHLAANIQYINEEEPLGTAGALWFLKDKIKTPFIVMNGDLLVKINFKHLIDFHLNYNALATMCVRESTYQVPYGVVTMDDVNILKIQEKPTYSYFINAGIYCLNNIVFDFFNKNQYINMPTLFQEIINAGKTVCAFPIHEYWVDIGSMDDYQKATLGYVT